MQHVDSVTLLKVFNIAAHSCHSFVHRSNLLCLFKSTNGIMREGQCLVPKYLLFSTYVRYSLKMLTSVNFILSAKVLLPFSKM